VPSEPAVLKVPCCGWKDMAFTEKTLATSRCVWSGWRWHLKEKFKLDGVLVGKYYSVIWVAYLMSFSSTYWMAHRPSMEPTAKPVASVKQLTTRVCHFSGLVIVL
jgi:hypothetical protein